MDIERRALRLIRDRSSGSAQIAVQTAEILAEARNQDYPQKKMDRLSQRIVRAHSAMGAVWNASRAEDPTEFARQLRVHSRETLKQAREQLPDGGRVVTLSYSSTIVKLLGRKGYEVTVTESLPGGEGKRTARKLKRTAAAATVVPDATMMASMATADFTVVGADAITPTHFVNKVGTYLLCLAARAADVPAYVVADGTKIVPDDWPLPEPGPKQVFEAVPRGLATLICDVL